MSHRLQNKGGLFAIAWPETTVQREGKWYDQPLTYLGFIKNDHLAVGHAAMFIVNYETGEVNYFDFGRYIAPYQHGRVRDKITDPELELYTKAQVKDDYTISNINEILLELSNLEGAHGHGRMLVSEYTGLDYNHLYSEIKSMQNRGVIPYGPLKIGGTNCSRFVAQIADKVVNDAVTSLLLKLPYTITSTPLFNIRVINNRGYYYEVVNRVCYQISLGFFTPFIKPVPQKEVLYQWAN